MLTLIQEQQNSKNYNTAFFITTGVQLHAYLSLACFLLHNTNLFLVRTNLAPFLLNICREGFKKASTEKNSVKWKK